MDECPVGQDCPLLEKGHAMNAPTGAPSTQRPADEAAMSLRARWWQAARGSPLLVVTVMIGATAGTLALFGWNRPAEWLVLIFAAGVGLRLTIGMLRDLIHGHTGIDILAVTAIASTLAVGEYAAAMVVVLMLTGGHALEDYASARAQRELTALLAAAPRIAHLVRESSICDVSAEEVRVGDTVLVRPSETVPVDGVLLSAAATFDESSLTGESLPVERGAGEQVLSGAVNGTAAVTITATATAADSQFAQIVQLVHAATQSRSRVVRLADRYAVPFTLVACALAAAAWIVSGSATRFAAVLVVATPCPLLIAAPAAFLGGMSRAARRGIIVKSSTALEIVSRVRTVAFDKTGTLTRGRPTLLQVASAGSCPADRLLALVAAAELHSSHVLAASVTQAAVDRGLRLPAVTSGREWATHGVSATVDGHRIRVGKPAFVAETGAVVPELYLEGENSRSTSGWTNSTPVSCYSRTCRVRSRWRPSTGCAGWVSATL
jgi:cation transport ATPase